MPPRRLQRSWWRRARTTTTGAHRTGGEAGGDGGLRGPASRSSLSRGGMHAHGSEGGRLFVRLSAMGKDVSAALLTCPTRAHHGSHGNQRAHFPSHRSGRGRLGKRQVRVTSAVSAHPRPCARGHAFRGDPLWNDELRGRRDCTVGGRTSDAQFSCIRFSWRGMRSRLHHEANESHPRSVIGPASAAAERLQRKNMSRRRRWA